MGNIVGLFLKVWLHPWDTMQEVKAQGENTSIKSSMVFIVVMALISGIITAILGTINPPVTLGVGASKLAIWSAVLLVPAVSFAGSFIGAFIIWGIVDGLLRGTATQYFTSYRLLAVLAAFSPVSTLLTSIPKVGEYIAIAVNVWATIVMIRGIIIVRGTKSLRTWITCIVIFGLLLLLAIFARIATQRQLAGGPGFGEFGAGETLGGPATAGNDMGAASNLDKQLEELANKAKGEQQPAQPK